MDRDAFMISFMRGTPRVISDFIKKTNQECVHGCNRHNLSKRPDFSARKIKFPGLRHLQFVPKN